MYSIGGKVVDIYDDVGLKKLAESGYLTKVGTLSIDDPSKIEELSDDKFGVVFMTKKGEFIRKFPTHDFSHAVLANVYFEITHDRLPPEAKVAAATNIKCACELFKMKPLPAVEKYALDPPKPGAKYIQIEKIATRIPEPIRLFEDLNQAYEDNRDRYSREEKRKLAEAMAPVAEKYSFDIPIDLKPFLIKDAAVDELALFAQCAVRKNLVQDKPEAMELMDEMIEKRASFEPGDAVVLLETFDKKYNLDRYWERGLEPNTILMEKTARHTAFIKNRWHVNENEIADFTSKHGELLEKMFGKDMADKMRKDPKGEYYALPTASRNFLAARMEQERENAITKAK